MPGRTGARRRLEGWRTAGRLCPATELVAGEPVVADGVGHDPVRGLLRAVLLLENRLLHGAFTAERLDSVKLIAGQLAVSLDNAQLYAELTTSRARIIAAGDQARRRIDRTCTTAPSSGWSRWH